MTDYRIESGSFRDPNGRVFYFRDNIYRGLGEKAFCDWKALSSKKLFPRFLAAGKLVGTTHIDPTAEGIPPDLIQGWAAVLKHQSIPFVSYPYEWSFSMLKDAALLQLELLLAALDEDMILKDSSTFNIQWFGTTPVFIDIPSFEILQPHEPWIGYRQFCQLFLYPLFLQAYKNVDFHPWLSLGIDPANLRYRDHDDDELAHYSKMCVDIEYLYPFTAPDFGELEGIAHRGCFDLTQHGEHSGTKMEYFDQERQVAMQKQGLDKDEIKAKSKYIPNVIEPGPVARPAPRIPSRGKPRFPKMSR